jgi:hypothetical protein
MNSNCVADWQTGAGTASRELTNPKHAKMEVWAGALASNAGDPFCGRKALACEMLNRGRGDESPREHGGREPVCG